MPMSDICKRNMMICFGQLMINAFFSVSDRKRKIRVNLTCSVLYWYCTETRMYSHTLSQGKMIYHGQIQFSRHHPRQKLPQVSFPPGGKCLKGHHGIFRLTVEKLIGMMNELPPDCSCTEENELFTVKMQY